MKFILPILLFLMVTPTWADYYAWDAKGLCGKYANSGRYKSKVGDTWCGNDSYGWDSNGYLGNMQALEDIKQKLGIPGVEMTSMPGITTINIVINMLLRKERKQELEILGVEMITTVG